MMMMMMMMVERSVGFDTNSDESIETEISDKTGGFNAQKYIYTSRDDISPPISTNHSRNGYPIVTKSSLHPT